MAQLEDLKTGVKVEGIVPGLSVAVVHAQWRSATGVELFFKRADGSTESQLVWRRDEPKLEIDEMGQTWSFDTDAKSFRRPASGAGS